MYYNLAPQMKNKSVRPSVRSIIARVPIWNFFAPQKNIPSTPDDDLDVCYYLLY